MRTVVYIVVGSFTYQINVVIDKQKNVILTHFIFILYFKKNSQRNLGKFVKIVKGKFTLYTVMKIFLIFC